MRSCLTPLDTFRGDVVDRAAKGERATITRSGSPVAELRPLTANLHRSGGSSPTAENSQPSILTNCATTSTR